MKIKKMLLNNKVFLGILFLLMVFCLPALLPLFHSGFFVTDDGDWMIIRFSAFYQAFADGQIPVRFLHRLNFDAGYPVATFLYPGFMYAAIPIHLVKIGVVETIKIVIGTSLIATTLFTFFWLLKVFAKKSAAFVGALISLYLPYHLFDLYTRGSVGEVFAFVWVPFLLWMIERRSVFLTGMGIGMLLLAHNSLALFFLPFLFLYALLRNSFSFVRLVSIFFLGIGSAAFFILPAVFELPLTQFSRTIISDPTAYFANLSLIGISTVLVFLAGCWVLFLKTNKQKVFDVRVLILFLAVTFFASFFSSAHSEFLWQFFPSSLIQFPFRLLSYLVVTTAFVAGYLVSQAENRMIRSGMIVAIILVSFMSSYQFLQPKAYVDKGDGYYTTNEATTTVQDEYMPVWVKEKPTQRAVNKVEIIRGKGEIIALSYDNRAIHFFIDAQEDIRIQIHTIYWPGWVLAVDSETREITKSNPEGLMEFTVPAGKHEVLLLFEETQVRFITDIISLISLLVLCFYSIKLNLKKGK